MKTPAATQAQLEFFTNSKKEYEEIEEPPKAFDFSVLRALIKSGNDEFTRLFTQKTYLPGEIIIHEDDAGNNICVIAKGNVVIFKGDINTPAILGYRTSGDLIGEMALLDQRPRSATVMALEKTTLLETDQNGFNTLLSKPPFFGLNLLENLTARLRVSDEMRSHGAQVQRKLVSQVSELETEKSHLLELQRLRQEMTDLIVHDLRNPLGSISFSIKTLQMLLPAEISQEHDDLFKIAISSSTRMQHLVDSMLEVSRMEAGETELVLTNVELPSFLDQIMHNVVYLYQDNFSFTYACESDLPSLSMDKDKIERVLTNLLDNAIKHTPMNGNIRVNARQIDKEIAISVYNDGATIPVEERQRIFERFAQVSGEKRRQRGFGLGLVYCRLTVEAHRGRIWVDPGDDGNGCRFTFTIPVSK